MDWHSEVYMEPDAAAFSRPPRSRLFGLEPVGAGTAESEGLVSFIVRLARAHSVEARLLVRAEFVRLCGGLGGVRWANFFSDYARTLHGTGTYALAFAEVTAALTMRSDIAQLTLLPWRGIVPAIGNGLLARHPRWCKDCLREQRDNRFTPHFPLAWYLELATACRRHGIRLSDRCPWCQRQQPFFPHAPHLERCAYCNGWLGSKSLIEPTSRAEEWEVWLAKAIGDMIAHNPEADGYATGEAFREVLGNLVDTYSQGDKSAFSQAMGMTRTTMSCWMIKRKKPLLPQFLKLCHRLDKMPSEFFGMPPQLVSPPEIDTLLPPRLHMIDSKFHFRQPAKQEIGQTLKRIAEDNDDVRSMTDIAKALHAPRSYLKYWFPESCLVISTRHKKHMISFARKMRAIQQNEVRIATFRIFSAGIYPSRRKVYNAIRPLKLSLKRPELRAAHKKALKILQG